MFENIVVAVVLIAVGYGLYRYAQHVQAKKELDKLGGSPARSKESLDKK